MLFMFCCYVEQTPAERVKAKMKLQLSESGIFNFYFCSFLFLEVLLIVMMFFTGGGLIRKFSYLMYYTVDTNMHNWLGRYYLVLLIVMGP